MTDIGWKGNATNTIQKRVWFLISLRPSTPLSIVEPFDQPEFSRISSLTINEHDWLELLQSTARFAD